MIGLIRGSLSDVPELLAWFDSTDPMSVPPVAPFRYRSWGLGFNGQWLCLNADQFGVFDVAAAVDLCSRLLGYRATQINYDLPDRWTQLTLAQQEAERRLEPIHHLDARSLKQAEAELQSTRKSCAAAWSVVSWVRHGGSHAAASAVPRPDRLPASSSPPGSRSLLCFERTFATLAALAEVEATSASTGRPCRWETVIRRNTWQGSAPDRPSLDG